MGIGDILVLNDPISGQGANNASRAAAFYAQEILNKKHGGFDEIWMTDTFNKFWQQEARWSTFLSNLLLAPPSAHMLKLFQEAEKSPMIANTVAQAFENPITFFPWILSPQLTHNFIEEVKSAEKIFSDPMPAAFPSSIKPQL